MSLLPNLQDVLRVLRKNQSPKPKLGKHDHDEHDKEAIDNARAMVASARNPHHITECKNLQESIDDFIINDGVILDESIRGVIQKFKAHSARTLAKAETAAVKAAKPVYAGLRHARRKGWLPKGENPFRREGRARRKQISRLQKTIAKHHEKSRQLMDRYNQKYNRLSRNMENPKQSAKFSRHIDRDLKYVRGRTAELHKTQSRLHSAKSDTVSARLHRRYRRIGSALKGAGGLMATSPGLGWLGAAVAGPKGYAAGTPIDAAITVGSLGHGIRTKQVADKMGNRTKDSPKGASKNPRALYKTLHRQNRVANKNRIKRT